MRIAIHHELSFSLGAARSVQHLLLTPMPTPAQRIERWSITMPGIEGAAAFRDAFGNRAHLVNQPKHEGDIVVTVTGTVETSDTSGVVGRLADDPVPQLFRRQPRGEAAPEAELLRGLEGKRERIAMLHELMARVAGAVPDPAPQVQMQTQGAPPPAPVEPAGATARTRSETFIRAARALDVPARYVTGYLLTDDDTTPGFHAWDDGLGWIGFDSLFELCPTERYVRVAAGLDAMSTRPIRSVPSWPEMPRETVRVEEA